MIRLFRRRPYVWEVDRAFTEQWLYDITVVPRRLSWWQRVRGWWR